MNTLTPVCHLCSIDGDIFYSRGEAEFTEHVRTMHVTLYDLRPCRSCGEPTTGHFDGGVTGA